MRCGRVATMFPIFSGQYCSVNCLIHGHFNDFLFGWPVVCCPTAEPAWKWETTNSNYGRFHVMVHREVPRSADAHMDCSRKVYELSREIEETKICLERAGIGHRFPIKPYRPRGGGCNGLRVPGAPQIGDCNCPMKPPAMCRNPYRTHSELEFNGGRRNEARMMEDHIKCCHPRLVKRLQPKYHPSILCESPSVTACPPTRPPTASQMEKQPEGSI